MRLLLTFAGNEGHLQPMRYLVLSPFPLSNGDPADPFRPTTHFFRSEQEPRPSAASSLLDQLAAGQRQPDGSEPLAGYRNVAIGNPTAGSLGSSGDRFRAAFWG